MSSCQEREERSSLEQFREALESFSFFHLGSDARLRFHERESSLSVSIEHDRVHPFTFQLSREELDEFVGDFERLEGFLLEQLTRNRRHL